MFILGTFFQVATDLHQTRNQDKTPTQNQIKLKYNIINMKLSFAASFLSMPFLAKGHTPSELSDGQLKQPIIKDLKDFEDGTIPLSFEAAEHETVATSKFKTRLFD